MHQDNQSDIGNTQLYIRPNREQDGTSARPGCIPPTVPPPTDTDGTKAELKPSAAKNIIPLTVPPATTGTTTKITPPPAEEGIRKIDIHRISENKAPVCSTTPITIPISPAGGATGVFRKPEGTPVAIPSTVPVSVPTSNEEHTGLISRKPGASTGMPATVPVNVPDSGIEPTRLITRKTDVSTGMPATVPVSVPDSGIEPTRLITRKTDASTGMPATVPVNVPDSGIEPTRLISRKPGTSTGMPATVPIVPSGQETSSGEKTRLITKTTGKVVPINVDYEAQPHTKYTERAAAETMTVPVIGIDPIPTSQAPHIGTTAKPADRPRRGGCMLPFLMLLLLLVAGAGLWYYGPVLVAPCISKGYTNGARLLTAIPGLNPNIPGENGQPPLTMAIQAGNMEAVRVLLAAPGIDINYCDSQGHPPIYYAAALGNMECVRHLLAMPGITVPANAVDIAEQNKHHEIAALLRAGKDYAMNTLSAQGITPDTYSIALLAAATAGDTARLQLLLTAGATAETLDSNGRSALFLAVDKNHVDCVRLLLTAPGTDVNTPNVNNITPLWVSAISGHTECMRLLLTVPEINVNHADEDGETALYWAAQQGHKDCVRMLLAVPGINVNCATNSGATPLQRATANGHRECANMLRAAGAQ